MRAYTRELIELARHEHFESRNRVVGYLFVLNAGGLAAGVAFVAAKQPAAQCGALAAIILFSVGLGATMLRAAFDYYGCERYMTRLMAQVKAFYSNQMPMESFLSERDNPGTPQWPFHLLGWFSAACFFVGLIVGVVAISR